MSVQPRLNRLFAPDGKCFDVAIDHGFFNERSFLGGIESMPVAIRTIIAAAPDAIQLSPGEARHLQEIAGKAKPVLVRGGWHCLWPQRDSAFHAKGHDAGADGDCTRRRDA